MPGRRRPTLRGETSGLYSRDIRHPQLPTTNDQLPRISAWRLEVGNWEWALAVGNLHRGQRQPPPRDQHRQVVQQPALADVRVHGRKRLPAELLGRGPPPPVDHVLQAGLIERLPVWVLGFSDPVAVEDENVTVRQRG